MNNETKILLETIQTLNEFKYKLKNMSNYIDNKLLQFEIILLNQCNHEWEIDHSYLGEKTQYQCRFCNLYK